MDTTSYGVTNIANSYVDIIGSIPLKLSGWQSLSDENRNIIVKNKRCVMVFSHTSRVEFFIYILYWLSWNVARKRSVVLINSMHMARWGWICRWFGAITAPSVYKKNCGSTQRIIDHLKDKDEFIFMLSPKGTSHLREWRTGYFHIAQALNCPVIAVGFDYNTHSMCVKEVLHITPDITHEYAMSILQGYMADIVPLHKDKNEYPLTMEAKNARASIFPINRVIIYSLIILYCLYRTIM